MKLLIISGTPKTDGVTHSFVERATKSASELNLEFDVIRLSNEKLAKCKMCADGWGICFTEHRCVFGDKDGFDALLEKVQNADAYVYITPVYWGEVSEELKLFLDKLRRCQATKQWDSREDEVTFLKGKPSIIVAVAGGGGGGIVNTFSQIERAISHMGGDEWPRETDGVFDYIAVNRWNQEYKREALAEAIKAMKKFQTRANPKSVAALPDYKLLVTFDNGEEQTFDITPYLESGRHKALKDVNLFNRAKISGHKVEWRPLLDFDINDLMNAL